MKTSSYLKGKTFLATLYNNTCIWCIHVYNSMSVIFSITILAWRNSTQVFFIIWYLYYKVSHTCWSRAKQRTVVSAFPYHICLRQFSIQCFKCNNQKIMWLSSSCLLKYKKEMKNIEYWFYMRKPPQILVVIATDILTVPQELFVILSVCYIHVSASLLQGDLKNP